MATADEEYGAAQLTSMRRLVVGGYAIAVSGIVAVWALYELGPRAADLVTLAELFLFFVFVQFAAVVFLTVATATGVRALFTSRAALTRRDGVALAFGAAGVAVGLGAVAVAFARG